MKVLHLATHDNLGGAARAAYRQHEALVSEGIDSRMLVRYKHSDDPAVAAYYGKRSIGYRFDRTVRRALINRREKAAKSIGKGGLTDPRSDLLRSVVPEIEEADVLNIHKTEHFVDIPSLFHNLPPDKPVVLTIHDLSPLTGGCDYPGTCRRFTERCGKCPILISDSHHDFSWEISNLLKKAYSTRNFGRFALVANSNWTGENARISYLTSDCRIEVIHLCVDQRSYSPSRREEARMALGIGAEEEVLCFAANNINLVHKGGRYLSEALSVIPKERKLRLLTMGSGHFRAGPHYRHIHFGRVDSDELQALIYKAADVFIIPSMEEAFGQTALEAVACGTVVAGFKVGGIVDIVQNGLNGELVGRGDSVALSQAIVHLLDNPTMRAEWCEMAAGWVNERFSYQRNASLYKELYSSIIK